MHKVIFRDIYIVGETVGHSDDVQEVRGESFNSQHIPAFHTSLRFHLGGAMLGCTLEELI